MLHKPNLSDLIFGSLRLESFLTEKAEPWRTCPEHPVVLLNINRNGGGSSGVYGGFISNRRLDQTRNLPVKQDNLMLTLQG